MPGATTAGPLLLAVVLNHYLKIGLRHRVSNLRTKFRQGSER